MYSTCYPPAAICCWDWGWGGGGVNSSNLWLHFNYGIFHITLMLMNITLFVVCWKGGHGLSFFFTLAEMDRMLGDTQCDITGEQNNIPFYMYITWIKKQNEIQHLLIIIYGTDFNVFLTLFVRWKKQWNWANYYAQTKY